MLANCSSLITSIPSCSAFASFEPAFSPAITKSVFEVTLPVTFAPFFSKNYFASFLVNSTSLPVNTTVFPEKILSELTAVTSY